MTGPSDLPVHDTFPGARPARSADRALKSGRHGMPPEKIAEVQRARLVDACAEVVATHGFGATTIAKVAAAAGVNKRTFYAYFADLEECFLAVFEYGTPILMTLMAQAHAAEPTWAEGTRAALRIMLKLLAAHPAFAKVSVVEVHAAGPRARAARLRYLEGFRTYFTDHDQGPVLPKTVVDAIVAGIYGAIYLHIETDRTADLPDLLPELAYFALLPVVGHEGAAEVSKL